MNVGGALLFDQALVIQPKSGKSEARGELVRTVATVREDLCVPRGLRQWDFRSRCGLVTKVLCNAHSSSKQHLAHPRPH